MNQPQQKKLPLLKKKSLLRKSTLSVSRIEKSKSKAKLQEGEGQRCSRKLNSNSRGNFNMQKRSLSHKKFSLKRILTEKTLRTSKLSQRNTDDNSQRERNSETFEDSKKSKDQSESITSKAIELLKNMKQVDKIAKLYKRNSVKSKNSEDEGQNKKYLKSKYKCLVNPDVFVKKTKHNNSDGAKSAKDTEKNHSTIGEDFWGKINQSLILESFRHEQPSKQLFDLVENIRTQI